MQLHSSEVETKRAHLERRLVKLLTKNIRHGGMVLKTLLEAKITQSRNACTQHGKAFEKIPVLPAGFSCTWRDHTKGY